jgi:hypothetical protein
LDAILQQRLCSLYTNIAVSRRRAAHALRRMGERACAAYAASAAPMPRYSTNNAAVLASDKRKKCSPTPVQEMAQLALSANVPAPMTGESPTRPRTWFVTPPVEVAAARLSAKLCAPAQRDAPQIVS